MNRSILKAAIIRSMPKQGRVQWKEAVMIPKGADRFYTADNSFERFLIGITSGSLEAFVFRGQAPEGFMNLLKETQLWNTRWGVWKITVVTDDGIESHTRRHCQIRGLVADIEWYSTENTITGIDFVGWTESQVTTVAGCLANTYN